MNVVIDPQLWEAGVRDGAVRKTSEGGERDSHSYLSGYIEGKAYSDGFEVSRQVADICEGRADVKRQTKSHQSSGIELIAVERVRQITAEGYSAEHDDGHAGGELALAAACYAATSAIYLHECDGAEEFRFSNPWPFDPADDFRAVVARAEADRPDVRGECGRLTPLAWRLRLLAKAGALIAAEIDRLMRAERVPEESHAASDRNEA